MPRKKTKKLKIKKSALSRNKNTRIQSEPIMGENIPIVFAWVTTDFKKKPMMELYYAIAAFGAMAMIGWGIYSRSFITAATFIMMVIAIILALNEEPKKVAVKISEKGIDLNNIHYNFSEFRSFKISRADGSSILALKPRDNFSFFKRIDTENEPVNDLESFLGIYLEKEEGE